MFEKRHQIIRMIFFFRDIRKWFLFLKHANNRPGSIFDQLVNFNTAFWTHDVRRKLDSECVMLQNIVISTLLPILKRSAKNNYPFIEE